MRAAGSGSGFGAGHGKDAGPAGSGGLRPTTGGPTGSQPGYVTTPRGPSARITLAIDWKYPRPPAPQAKPGETVALPRRHALPADEALRVLAGDDPRPLLVLRECPRCSGTESALLCPDDSNERTYLLARWFHCVRLTPDTLDEDAPFRNLFPGEKPAHVFVANHDGTARHDLAGTYSRSELWDDMEGALEANYETGYASVMQRLTRLLDSLDGVDQVIADLETRLELAASDGGDARKTRALQAELNERRTQRDQLLTAAEGVSALKSKPLAPVVSER